MTFVQHFASIANRASLLMTVCVSSLWDWRQHSRWCIVPLIAAVRLLSISSLPNNVNQIAVQSDRNTAVCSLVIAQFRRLLRQEGAFLHQNACLAKPPPWWIDELLCQITRQSHLQLRLERFLPPAQRACTLNHTNLQLSSSTNLAPDSSLCIPTSCHPDKSFARRHHWKC